MNATHTAPQRPRRPSAGSAPAGVTAATALLATLLAGCAGLPQGQGAARPAAGGTSTAAANAPALTPQRIAALVAAPDRSAADRTNDLRRKPAELLGFIGVRPGMVVLDLSAGGGYTTELLARAVGPTGRVYGQSPPPGATPPRPPAAPEGGMAGPAAAGASAPAGMTSAGAATQAAATVAVPAPAPRRTSAQALAERARNPNAGNIVAVAQPFEAPVPADAAAGGLDLVTLMFNYHDLGHAGVDRGRMNRAVYAALKPGGLYVVADHAGRPGTGISEAGTLHRIEEAFLRREVEAAGFVFVAEAGFLRNPADPRDRNTPEPPQPKDDFVLKFVKPAR